MQASTSAMTKAVRMVVLFCCYGKEGTLVCHYHSSKHLTTDSVLSHLNHKQAIMDQHFWHSDVKKPRMSAPMSFMGHVPFQLALIMIIACFFSATGATTQSQFKDLPPVQLIDQPVDHFNMQDGDSFYQRYWSQSRWWKPQPTSHAPLVLLQVTSVASTTYTPQQMNSSTLATWAQNLDALLITLESRYTGLSTPFNDNYTTVDLKFDTTDQHLQDVVAFIVNQTAVLSLPNNTRWILIGSLFDGGYVTWFRSKFPQLSFGSIAFSPYLKAQAANTGYDSAYQRFIGPDCTAAVHDAFAAVIAAFATYNDAQKTAYMESCGCDFAMTTGDAEFFYTTSIALIGELGWNTASICTNLTSAHSMTSDKQMANLAALLKGRIFVESGDTCAGWNIVLDTTQQSFRSIFYMQCAELGQFEVGGTTTSSLIPAPVNDAWFQTVCTKLFGHVLRSGPNYPIFNANNGGSSPGGCNLAFVTSRNDPYTSIGPDRAAVMASSGSNRYIDTDCTAPLDNLSIFSSPTDSDPPCLSDARASVWKVLEEWRDDPIVCASHNKPTPSPHNNNDDGDDDKATIAAAVTGVVVGVVVGTCCFVLGAVLAQLYGRRAYMALTHRQWDPLN
eukprot:TRINITY_DN661_c0_g1_i1.p1 TRINITY_DN661_c0_g1~~TRINITY_DN661_c0_g1_i1.p1  ORF type:complete len:615 (-),score=87.45 TRINITY_DN661_c0_g1_i1:79-1923(-)